jgi:NAD(P)H-hydrate epimerase
MVFFATAPSNITLMREAKRAFWNGIVIDRADAAGYAQEADVILIGPGMERSEETATFTNDFLKQFPDQHWVIDAGALQMADIRLFTEHCIVTPHEKEWADLQQRMHAAHLSVLPSVIVQKGPTDRIFQKDHTIAEVSGGHPGMTKGGTGDVLAGLVAALYCTNPIEVAAVVGSVLNKRAGESLAHRAGPFFNASDLVEEVPKTAWELFQLSNQSKH